MAELERFDASQLRRYLLLEMADEEREEFELIYLSNPELQALLEAEEDRLLRDYIEGRLDAETHEKIDACCRESIGMRRRLQEMQVMLEWLRRYGRKPVVMTRRMWWISAAAGLTVGFAGWRWMGQSAGTARIVRAVLGPGQLRSEGAAEVDLGVGGAMAEMTLTGRPDVVSGLSVSISSPERGTVWSGRTHGDGSRVLVTVPAEALLRGDYLIDVTLADGDTVSYPVRFERRP